MWRLGRGTPLGQALGMPRMEVRDGCVPPPSRTSGITIRQSFLQVSIALPNWGPRMCECPCQRVALVLGKNEFVGVSLISER